MAEEQEYFTVREIANKFRVSEETIRRWIKNGDIDFTPIGPFKLKRLQTKNIIKEASNGQQGTAAASIEREQTEGAAPGIDDTGSITEDTKK